MRELGAGWDVLGFGFGYVVRIGWGRIERLHCLRVLGGVIVYLCLLRSSSLKNRKIPSQACSA